MLEWNLEWREVPGNIWSKAVKLNERPKVKALKLWICGNDYSCKNALRDEGKTKTKQEKFNLQNCKKVSPHSLYPYIDQKQSGWSNWNKRQMWNNIQISSREHSPTQVHSKMRHTTPYIFRSHVKEKTTKRLNDGTTFNAHAPFYSSAKP